MFINSKPIIRSTELHFILDGHTKVLKLLHKIGKGASSTVFKAQIEYGSYFAVKCFKDTHDFVNEAVILKKMKGIGPALYATDLETRTVLLRLYTPFIFELGKGNLALLLNLLDRLKSIHMRGFVHRDIRIANIMMDGDTPLFIDFAYAVKDRFRSKTIVGTTITASQKVLKSVAKGKLIRYTVKDDLESFLKICLILNEKAEISKCHRFPKRLFSFWSQYPEVVKMKDCNSYEETFKYVKEFLHRNFS